MNANLESIGAIEDEFGQFIIENARVTIYPVGSEYEIDIRAPKGCVGFDVSKGAITIKRDEQSNSDDIDHSYHDHCSEYGCSLFWNEWCFTHNRPPSEPGGRLCVLCPRPKFSFEEDQA